MYLHNRALSKLLVIKLLDFKSFTIFDRQFSFQKIKESLILCMISFIIYIYNLRFLDFLDSIKIFLS